MTWLIAFGVVGVLVGSAVGAKVVLDIAPTRLRFDGDPDAALDGVVLGGMAGCVRTTAVVTGLCQVGASRGMIRHRCRLDLLVDRPGAGDAAPAGTVAVAVVVDLGVEQLAWWLPGSVVDVAVDGPEVRECRPLFVSTRARATGRADLPPTTVRGLPKAVYLKPEERVLPPEARRTTAVIGSIQVHSASTGTTCGVTLGLWVDGEYATTVSDRFRLDELVALARGATVPVTVDPSDPLKVVVDADAATTALAARLPDVLMLRRVAAELGLAGPVAVVQSIKSGRGKRGVRYEYVATVMPGGDDGELGAPMAVRAHLAVPDAAQLVRGSAVVIDQATRTFDLAATAAARVHCTTVRR